MSNSETKPSGQPLVRCPSCSEQHPYSTDNPYRPFCGRGCQAIDLGAWASEQYRVTPVPALDELVRDIDGSDGLDVGGTQRSGHGST